MSETGSASATVGKKIVICLDGTGNQVKAKGHTNVVTLFEMLDLSDPSKQIAYYDPGVGTMSAANARGAFDKWFSRISGLAFGSGMKTNVAEAYTFLMRHWQPGDQIYIFGFSRGAYTARALVGMLNRPGLLRPGSENLVPYAVAQYATNKQVSDADLANIGEFAHAFCWGTAEHPMSPHRTDTINHDKWHSIPIAYLGVWDTVKAAGILRFGNLRWPYTHQLYNATHVRHAISIDEYRRPYREYLAKPRRFGLDEAWFAGVHSDVGGTFEPEHHLATITLKWMVDGVGHDLLLRPGAYAAQCTVDETFARGEVHRMGWIWILVGRRRRTFANDAKLHASVRERRKHNPKYLKDLVGADLEDRWVDPNWTRPAL